LCSHISCSFWLSTLQVFQARPHASNLPLKQLTHYHCTADANEDKNETFKNSAFLLQYKKLGVGKQRSPLITTAIYLKSFFRRATQAISYLFIHKLYEESELKSLGKRQNQSTGTLK